MNTNLNNTAQAAGDSRRACAILGGLSLLLMAILAPLIEFGIFQRLIVADNSATTAANLVRDAGVFRLGIAGFLFIAILDIVIAWALYVVFKPAGESLALLAGWLRVAYSAVLAMAVAALPVALWVLTNPEYSGAFETAQIHTQASTWLRAFRLGWDLGLAIFGVHLAVLGWLITRSGYAPRWLGVLLIVAGLSYFIDSMGKAAIPNYTLTLATYTFIGEVILIFWLLWRGIKGFVQQP